MVINVSSSKVMERDTIKQSIEAYKQQLSEINLALTTEEDGLRKDDLIGLRNNILELISLTQESLDRIENESQGHSQRALDDEFALFMAEMEKDGAVENKDDISTQDDLKKELEKVEGMKCRAPHTHQWGDIMYHNAVVLSVISSDENHTFDKIKVKIMFINPTHEEMLPCPFLMDANCKFSDDRCKYSHGESVLFSSLHEYIEPKYDSLIVGSKILAKQKNKLWGRATIRRIFKEKYLVKFDTDQNELSVEIQDILPLVSENEANEDISESSDDSDQEDVINMSLLNDFASPALGDWEKYTRGIGSKIMQKMGYIVGTGLGRFSDGRQEPVPAVALPPGKSLDHCMYLKEKAGDDKNLFSVERKLKRLQRKQEKRNAIVYQNEKKKVNVFNFLNETLTYKKEENPSLSKSKHRLEIKKESSRNLNVASLKIDENIKKTEKELYELLNSLKRHANVNSQMYNKLQEKLNVKQNELRNLKAEATNIIHEQRIRNDKKKLTVF